MDQFLSHTGYAQVSGQNAIAPAETLAMQFDQQLKRLMDIRQRVSSVGDAIHWPQPTAAGLDKNQGRPVTSRASRVRDLGEVTAAIEEALTRVQSGF